MWQFNFLDDHSRLLVACDVFPTVGGHDVIQTFHVATGMHGAPTSVRTANCAVVTSKARRGR